MIPPCVLLVEDDPSDIALTRRAFERCRISNPLVVAEDGQDALDFLFGEGPHAGRDTADQPVLILLDINLPRCDGLTVLRRLRADARTHRLPVVILTSSGQERDLAAGYDAGVNSYIRKPVDFAQFAAVIEQLGIYWLVTNRPPPAADRP